MNDESDELEAWGLAIHQAIAEEDDKDPTGMHRLSHGRLDTDWGEPQAGWIDGDMPSLGRALRAAGWRPPPDVVRNWRAEIEIGKARRPKRGGT